MYRLSTRIIGGVCSGLAHMIGIDTLLIRLIFIYCLFTTVPIVTIYILMWIFLPLKDYEKYK